MSVSDQPEQTPEPPREVEQLLATPEVAKAISTDEFKALLDHVPIAIIASKTIRGSQRIIYANAAFETLTGQPFTTIEEKTWSVLNPFIHEDQPGQTLGQAIMGGEDFIGTFRLDRGDAKPLLVQVYVSIIEKEDGSENYRLAALVDVSETARAQREAFEQQIRDKDLLLREIQHRVKNNLQLLIALIRLEARAARRGDRVDLDRLAGRIESLQFLYQTLSADSLGDEVDLGHYLSQIASAAVRTHSLDGIELVLKVNHAPVPVDIALPVGLAVNELLTNVFKYAFLGRDKGLVTLKCLREMDDHYTIVVADDGVGLPDGGTWPTPGKLGALVVQTLRENAKTNLFVEASPERGTRVTLSFVHKPAPTKPN
jgi:PAS domain S-box-containing protein